MRASRRPGVLVAAAAVVGLAVAALWWHAAAARRYPGANLPAGASPRQVVVAYLRALGAHDASTAAALSTPGYRDVAARWVRATAHIRDIRIRRVWADNSYGARTRGRFRHAEQVDTTFVYTGRHNDVTFPDGAHYWSYWLVWSGGRWQIDAEGQG